MHEATLSFRPLPPLTLSTKRLAYALLAITYFVLPISSSIKSITLSSFLILAMLTPAYRQAACRLLQTRWVRLLGLFVGIIILACLWGPGSVKDKVVSLEKYMKLLYLPFLVVMFRQAWARLMAIQFTLAGISTVAFLSIVSYFNWFPFISIQSDLVFRNHIVFGFMGAYGAYLATCLACDNQASRRQVVSYALLALVLTFQVLWINAGRMAYLLILLLALLWICQFLSWKKMIGAILIMGVSLTVIYHYSPTMHARFQATVSEFGDYRQAKLDTSLGFRVQMHRLARQLFFKHPFLGNGTGSYRILNEPLKLPEFNSLRDPHSQYWLIAAEQGLVGLLGLFGFLGVLFLETARLKQTGVLAMGLLLALCVSQITDSMLYYSGPGCFFMMIMAIYLGEAYENSV